MSALETKTNTVNNNPAQAVMDSINRSIAESNSTKTVTLNSTSKNNDFILITDIGSADIDDDLAIIMALNFHRKKVINLKAIVATHFFSDKRAKAVQTLCTLMGITDVPVYVDKKHIIPEKKDDSRKQFKLLNPGWPPIFGCPEQFKTDKENKWCPTFLKAYDIYAEKVTISDSDAKTVIIDMLKKYSPETPLKVICISSMHFLEDILSDNKTSPPTIIKEHVKNIKIYAMGGGYADGSFGYNWGVDPYSTGVVLAALDEAKTNMTLVSTELVRSEKVSMGSDKYEEWKKHVASKPSDLTTLIMNHWKDCLNSDKLTRDKFLCDPLTVLVACVLTNRDYQVLPTKMIVHHHLAKGDYLKKSVKPSENPLKTDPVMNKSQSNVLMITEFTVPVLNMILTELEEVLFELKTVDTVKIVPGPYESVSVCVSKGATNSDVDTVLNKILEKKGDKGAVFLSLPLNSCLKPAMLETMTLHRLEALDLNAPKLVYKLWRNPDVEDKIPAQYTALEAVACLVLSPDMKNILMVWEHDRPKWKLVTGYVDKNELPIDTAIREIKEETGIDIDESKVPHIIGGWQNTNSRFPGVNDNMTAFAFVAKNTDIKIEAFEIKEAKWVSFEKLEQLHKLGEADKDKNSFAQGTVCTTVHNPIFACNIGSGDKDTYSCVAVKWWNDFVNNKNGKPVVRQATKTGKLILY